MRWTRIWRTQQKVAQWNQHMSQQQQLGALLASMRVLRIAASQPRGDNCDVTCERYVRAIHMPLHACVAIFLRSSRHRCCRCALEGFEVGFQTCFPGTFLVKTRCQMPMANPSKDSGHPCLAGRWFWCVCYTFFSTAVNILAEGDKLSRLHATSADVFQTRMQAFIFRTFTPNVSKCQNFAVLQKHQYKARALWYESVARSPPKKTTQSQGFALFLYIPRYPEAQRHQVVARFRQGWRYSNSKVGACDNSST